MRLRFDRNRLIWLLSILLLAHLASACARFGGAGGPVSLRLEVSLTPEELASFQPALEALDQAHPDWQVTLELTPQAGVLEKINAQLASADPPDVIRVQGLMVQGWIRQEAFLDLSERIEQSRLDLGDFFPGPLEQFRWQERLWGLPDTAAPDLVFYNLELFERAGLPYPSDDWTYADMRAAAIRLTLDAAGRNPSDPAFDPAAIQQWGWNGGLTHFWQRHLVQAFGADFCANPDCTLLNFTSPPALRAVQWWADLVSVDHAALYDPYGGSQTGVPGDPFIAGKAAMGYNGFFAVGQLNASAELRYDIIQPLRGQDGQRHTPLSTNGYVISAASAHPQQAWALVQALLEPQFLARVWGQPGHSVPARRSVAAAVLDPSHPPANQAAILEALEYGQVFQPATASAFEAYSKTADFFVKAMKGELSVAEAMAQAEAAGNQALARDRTP